MIEKFNFYDVYGYFLPGFALLAVIWLPSGLIQQYWPVTALASALIVIPLAYLAGHLLQSLAVTALPSKAKQSDGTSRHPSDFLLDSANYSFSVKFKEELANDVSALFHLDLGIDNTSSREVSRARSDAFFLCRSTLIQAKSASYSEQFEGLYGLMRGLALACGLGCCYHVGWALASLNWDWARKVAMVAIGVELLAIIVGSALRKSWAAMWTLALIGAVLILIGYLLGYGRVTSEGAIKLGAIAVANLFMTLRFWHAYRSFAEHFAKAIYRDFYAYRRIQVETERRSK